MAPCRLRRTAPDTAELIAVSAGEAGDAPGGCHPRLEGRVVSGEPQLLQRPFDESEVRRADHRPVLDGEVQEGAAVEQDAPALTPARRLRFEAQLVEELNDSALRLATAQALQRSRPLNEGAPPGPPSGLGRAGRTVHRALDHRGEDSGEQVVAIADARLRLAALPVDDPGAATHGSRLGLPDDEPRLDQHLEVLAGGGLVEAHLVTGVGGAEPGRLGPDHLEEAKPAHLGKSLVSPGKVIRTGCVPHAPIIA